MRRIAVICIEPLLIQAFARMWSAGCSAGFDVDRASHCVLSAAYKSRADGVVCCMSHPEQPTRIAIAPRYRADVDRMSTADTRNLERLLEALIGAGLPVVSVPDALAADLVASTPATTSVVVRACDPIIFQSSTRRRTIQPFFNRRRRPAPTWSGLPPGLLPDYFALTGTSSSFPLVSSVDGDAAISLLRRHGSLESVLSCYSDRETFRNRSAELIRARDLMRPHPVNVNICRRAVSL